MSRKCTKERLKCIGNCLPIKSKAAKIKTQNKNLANSENEDFDYSLLSGAGDSYKERHNFTKNWLQDLSTIPGYDPDRTLRDFDSKDDIEVKGSGSKSQGDSSNESAVKSNLDDLSFSSTCAMLDMKATTADESGLTSVSQRHVKRNKERQRHRNVDAKNSIPVDTMSGASSCVSLDTELVTFDRTTSKSLGISVIGLKNANVDCGIFIGQVSLGGAADRSGKVEPGDLILGVNEIELEGMANEDALAVLKNEMDKKGPLNLLLAKYFTMDDSTIAKPDGIIEDMYEVEGSVYSRRPCSREGTLDRWASSFLPSENELAMRRRYEDHHRVQPPKYEFSSRPPSVHAPQNHLYHHQPAMTYQGSMLRPMLSSYADPGFHEIKKLASSRNLFSAPPSNDSGPFSLLPESRRPFRGSEVVDYVQHNIPGMSGRNDARKYTQSLFEVGFLSGPESRFHEGGWYAIQQSSDPPQMMPTVPPFY